MNNSVSIDARDIKIEPFDASSYDESNELRFVSVQSLDDELFWF